MSSPTARPSRGQTSSLSAPRPIGDGITDDTEAVQAMLDRGEFPPPGTYLIRKPLPSNGTDALQGTTKGE